MAFPRLSTIRGAVALAIGALVTISPAHAFAATDSAKGANLTMTPSSTELSIDPGKSASNMFQVINSGDQSFTVKPSALPYHVEGTNYDPRFTPLPGTTDASQWVKMDKTNNTNLGPHETLTVNYTVKVPAGTQPGGYYAVLFGEATPQTEGKGGVVPHTRVGNILYMTVNGPVKTEGNVKDGGLPTILFSEGLKAGMLVSNTGGVHFLTDAKISIKNVLGTQVFASSLQRYVLPQTSRQIDATWDHTPPVGLYKVSRSATVPSGTQTLPDKWVLVIQPWVIVAILVFIAAVTAMYLGKRRANRKK